jgi:hypothetical protein
LGVSAKRDRKPSFRSVKRRIFALTGRLARLQ